MTPHLHLLPGTYCGLSLKQPTKSTNILVVNDIHHSAAPVKLPATVLVDQFVNRTRDRSTVSSRIPGTAKQLCPVNLLCFVVFELLGGALAAGLFRLTETTNSTDSKATRQGRRDTRRDTDRRIRFSLLLVSSVFIVNVPSIYMSKIMLCLLI